MLDTPIIISILAVSVSLYQAWINKRKNDNEHGPDLAEGASKIQESSLALLTHIEDTLDDLREENKVFRDTIKILETALTARDKQLEALRIRIRELESKLSKLNKKSPS